MYIVGDVKMFDNLTKEIIILSLIPIVIIGISMVLSLISGYTIWIFKSFGKRGIIGSNIWYLLLLVFLWIYLLIMLIVMYVRLMKNANEDEKIDIFKLLEEKCREYNK